MLINEADFNDLAKEGYTRIPVIKEILADLETPLTMYLKIAKGSFSFLFESVHGGEKWGRYSFIVLPCKEIISVKDGKLQHKIGNELLTEIETTTPLDWINTYIKHQKIPEIKTLPTRFCGGLIGYFGYDTIRYIEPKLYPCPLKDSLDVPDILLALAEEIIIYDRLTTSAYLIVYADPQKSDAYEKAVERVNVLSHALKNKIIADESSELTTATEFTANMTKHEFEEKVKRAVEYFKAGDAMQMTFSQRLTKPFPTSPFGFYRALRRINPSPYMFFQDFGEFQVIGSSPEILVRLEDNTATIRPLAGTRPRGKTPDEDLALEKELLSDPKERSEHLMLIDLARNDLGRMCTTGSIKVTEKMVIERYSHVMHISSNVEGNLQPGLSAIDVLKAAFPAGTVSGTPKIRAMEMIDELEPEKRGVYAGAVGYISWNGNMDLAIALRTAVIKNNTLFVQAGGGLVVDSIPENEWQESMNKAKALFKAAELVEVNFNF